MPIDNPQKTLYRLRQVARQLRKTSTRITELAGWKKHELVELDLLVTESFTHLLHVDTLKRTHQTTKPQEKHAAKERQTETSETAEASR